MSPIQYRACDIGLTQSDPQANNWLISDQIEVSEANRIDITVEYYIKSCSSLPNSGGYYCDDKFGLYVNQSDKSIKDGALYPDPLNNAAAYENVAEISQPTDLRTIVTINSLVKGKYVLLAFHNSGACTTLYSVKVTYNVCPGKTLSNSLATLPRTVAPANDSEAILVEGHCNIEVVQVAGSLNVRCEDNGEWNTTGLEGKCVCREDTQNMDGKCQGMLSLSNIFGG